MTYKVAPGAKISGYGRRFVADELISDKDLPGRVIAEYVDKGILIDMNKKPKSTKEDGAGE